MGAKRAERHMGSVDRGQGFQCVDTCLIYVLQLLQNVWAGGGGARGLR